MSRPPLDLWGIHAPLEELTGGNRNTVWRTRGLPKDLVFKSTQRSEVAMAWLSEVQAIARAAGLNVPQMHCSLSDAWTPEGWICEDFVQGAAIPPAAASDLSAPLNRFHEMSRAVSQRPGFCATADLLTRAAGGDVDLTQMPADLVALCRAAWSAVQTTPLSVVHGDLAQGNLLRNPLGHLWLIDWDECRRDLPLFDRVMLEPLGPLAHRAHLAWEVACGWQREPEYACRLEKDLRGI
ncbi:phosphotransferase [Shimia sp. MMG029]|uniref:phosphotransferase n=1 Tax=Shimia sp. MMG029 TaxID=3021978 RepID=UPI0022FE7690|nr:phosphotransferase [Shimia sp. MMG029]MDA5556543.1 phosphotransferase [Shimia sp. MMG029]